jgi:hypothetical protein
MTNAGAGKLKALRNHAIPACSVNTALENRMRDNTPPLPRTFVSQPRGSRSAMENRMRDNTPRCRGLSSASRRGSRSAMENRMRDNTPRCRGLSSASRGGGDRRWVERYGSESQTRRRAYLSSSTAVMTPKRCSAGQVETVCFALDGKRNVGKNGSSHFSLFRDVPVPVPASFSCAFLNEIHNP